MKTGVYLDSLISVHMAKFHENFGDGKYGKVDSEVRLRLESNYLYWKISREYIRIKRKIRDEYLRKENQ